jgi:hypothetical protein
LLLTMAALKGMTGGLGTFESSSVTIITWV